jgi:hypothetical protein
VIQLSKYLNHTLATHNQVDSFFENINHNDGEGAFTLTLFEMTITDCPGFHVPHCTYVEIFLSEKLCRETIGIFLFTLLDFETMYQYELLVLVFSFSKN